MAEPNETKAQTDDRTDPPAPAAPRTLGHRHRPNERRHQAVVVQITGPAGVKVSFLPPLVAQQVGEQLIDHSRQARSGLIVPTGVQMPSLPNGQQP